MGPQQWQERFVTKRHNEFGSKTAGTSMNNLAEKFRRRKIYYESGETLFGASNVLPILNR